MKLRFLLPFLLLIAASCGTQPDQTARHIAQLEEAVLPLYTIQGQQPRTVSLQARMDSLNVPGVSIAVIKDGEIAWARAYGMADREEDRPVSTETLFQAASISKPVAALAALDMTEEGLIGLDTDVNTYLQSWQLPGNGFTENEKVTLRRILNHTAGTTVWGFPGYNRRDTLPTTVQVLSGEGNTDAIEVFKEPGESWRYSGGGYTVMQLMLSDVAGKPFPQIMEERVLGPAGMDASTYRQPLPEAMHGNAASAYRSDGSKIDGNWHVYPEMAAAGLWTTPSDLARYVLEVQQSYAGREGTILDRETTVEMLTPGMNGHGLGPGISSDSLAFSHGGSNEGFRCIMIGYKDGSGGLVVMTNSDTGGRLMQEIVYTVSDLYGWPGYKPPEKILADLETDQLERLTGTYQLEGIGEATVSLTDGRLTAEVPAIGQSFILLPESPTQFFMESDMTPVEFLEEEGRVTGILVAGNTRGEKTD